MARRRLAPLPRISELVDVPRAEHLLPHAPGLPAAPIAAPIAVAAEAAGSAALQELADTLKRARETGRLVLDLPLDAIAPDHLGRDRIDRLPADDADMASLRESLRAHGQRTPIEVVPLTGRLPYGLLSGWRRLIALKALHAETGDARFATVQALVRRPETAAAAYVAMVEENEIRLGLSQYERARVAARAAARGVFADEEAALRALFATASRPKRSRIRAFVALYHGLDAALRFPAAIPERLGLALVERLREGRGAGDRRGAGHGRPGDARGRAGAARPPRPAGGGAAAGAGSPRPRPGPRARDPAGAAAADADAEGQGGRPRARRARRGGDRRRPGGARAGGRRRASCLTSRPPAANGSFSAKGPPYRPVGRLGTRWATAPPARA